MQIHDEVITKPFARLCTMLTAEWCYWLVKQRDGRSINSHTTAFAMVSTGKDADSSIACHWPVLLSYISTEATGLQQPNTANCQPPSATVSMHSANRAQLATHFELLPTPPTTKSRAPIAVQLWLKRAVASGGIEVHSLVLLSYISIEASTLQQPNMSSADPARRYLDAGIFCPAPQHRSPARSLQGSAPSLRHFGSDQAL